MTRTVRVLRISVLLLVLGLVVGALAPGLRPPGGLWSFAGIALAALVVARLASVLARHVPRHAVLELDLTDGVVEKRSDSPLARLRPARGPVLHDVSDALRRAARDRRVDALLARIGSGGIPAASVEEIRAAVAAFRAAGKRAVAFAESLGEGANGTLGVWLAAAFDEVRLQPMGDVSLVGLRRRVPFLRGLLDRLGVLPRLDHRREYKGARYVFTETGMPAPFREESERLLDSMLGEVVRGISEGRGLAEERVRALIEEGPHLGREAVEAGLVDGFRYRDEVVDELTGERPERLLDHAVYLRRAGRPDRKGPRVALVTATGAIESGRGRWRPFPPGFTMGAEDVTAALRAARRDERVKAIVFRIDSPGGSAVASEAIRREVVLAGEAGKPVVVSMGNVAGSGGYWIAMSAARIVARATTLTGSIGVVWGKFVTAGALEKVGIRLDGVDRGERAGMWAADRDFDEAEWARLQDFLDEVYEAFVGRVAEARGLDRERVEEIARGRVWTGRDAMERGLVDAIGGFPEAFDLVRETAGLAPGAPLRVVTFPRRSRLGRLFRRRSSSEDVRLVLDGIARGVELPGPLLMSGPWTM